MKWMITMKPLVILACCAMLCMVADIRICSATPDKEQAAAASIILQSVQLRGEGSGTELVISASVPATYTSYKTTAPARLVVDFSQAIPSADLADVKLSGGPVKGVTLKRFDTDAGALTRMEIILSQDVDPVITPSTAKIGELLISFPGYVPTAEAQAEVVQPKPVADSTNDTAAPAQPAELPTQQVSVTTASTTSALPAITAITADAEAITIATTAAMEEYRTFRLNKPERVVIDLPNARSALSETLVQLNSAGVGTARVGNYPDKVRIVFDALSGTLPEAAIEKTAFGLKVTFRGSAQTPAKPAAVAVSARSESAAPARDKDEAISTVQATALDFQALEGLSRVMVKLSGPVRADDPVKTAGALSFRLRDTLLPKQLQRSLETREFVTPVLRVTPVQLKTKTGHDLLVRVTLKMDASFELKRETDVVYLDIKHPEMLTTGVQLQKAAPTQKAAVARKPMAADSQLEAVVEQQSVVSGKRQYTGRKVTLEFADAEVRKIFQLLSEVSGKNFVLGDEVTGNISLKLVNVPWDQALDIILDTKGLDKREEGNIILIRGKGKFKSLLDEELEIRKATLKTEPLETAIFEVNYAELAGIVSQFNALKTDRGIITSDTRTNKVIVKDVKTALADMRKLLKDLDVPEKQVMIEARIVEASSDFTRSLGISWGLTNSKGFGNPNNMSTIFGGIASTPGAITSTTLGATTGAADITFGTIGSNIKLSMRLNAAAKAGLVRIVSSPKVATLNNKSAKITQGKQIPYISATSDKVETKFVEAALSLEVTPHINNNGTIVLKIDAKNDAPDTTTSGSTTPPINKKQATTEMLLKDGETTVIGGIFVDSETEGEEGVPWLMDVPLLGNLFKSKTYVKGKSELLIFITPRILNTPT